MLHFGSDLETCQLTAAVLVLTLLLHGQGAKGREPDSSGSAISRVWQVPTVVPTSPSAYHPLDVGAVQVCECGWWLVPSLAQVPIHGKWVALSNQQPRVQTGSTWGAGWQLC